MFRIEYKMSLNASVLEGDIPAVGFMYGPTVLCAKLGKERMNELIEAGIDVKACTIVKRVDTFFKEKYLRTVA